MKKIIFISLISVIVNFLVGCGFSKLDIDNSTEPKTGAQKNEEQKLIDNEPLSYKTHIEWQKSATAIKSYTKLDRDIFQDEKLVFNAERPITLPAIVPSEVEINFSFPDIENMEYIETKAYLIIEGDRKTLEIKNSKLTSDKLNPSVLLTLSGFRTYFQDNNENYGVLNIEVLGKDNNILSVINYLIRTPPKNIIVESISSNVLKPEAFGFPHGIKEYKHGGAVATLLRFIKLTNKSKGEITVSTNMLDLGSLYNKRERREYKDTGCKSEKGYDLDIISKTVMHSEKLFLVQIDENLVVNLSYVIASKSNEKILITIPEDKSKYLGLYAVGDSACEVINNGIQESDFKDKLVLANCFETNVCAQYVQDGPTCSKYSCEEKKRCKVYKKGRNSETITVGLKISPLTISINKPSQLMNVRFNDVNENEDPEYRKYKIFDEVFNYTQ